MLCLLLKQPCGTFALEERGDPSDPHDWQAIQRLPRPATAASLVAATSAKARR